MVLLLFVLYLTMESVFLPKERKPHVVVLPYPAQGHLTPILHLVHKIAKADVTVTLVVFDSMYTNLRSQWKCPRELDIRLEKVECELHIPCGIETKSLQDTRGMLDAIDKVEVPFEELVKRLQPSPCCIISDYFVHWALQLTKRLKLQVVTYWPGSAAWSSVHHHVDMLFSHGVACQADRHDDNEVVSYIPGIDSIRFRDLPSYYRRKLDEEVLKFFQDGADRMKDADWVLVNSIFELEHEAFRAMQESLCSNRFISVGPLFTAENSLKVGLRREDRKCLEFLDKQDPMSVLYVCFGSMCMLDETQFEELAAGLEASNHPFIWVVTVKRGEFILGFMERTAQRGLVVDWAPQLEILSHRATGGFLSHCGWNSMLESIFYGVPLLGRPCHSEQNMNCKLLEEWRIGRRMFMGREIGREEIAKQLHEFMEYRNQTADGRETVKGVARHAVSESGSSQSNLKIFIQALKSLECF